MSDLVIETKKLTKIYGEQTAVNSVNLHVKPGRIYGLLGRNGAGKPTIMNMILGLTPITSGEVDVFGQNIKGHEKRIYPRIGAIIETPGFYPNLTGTENLDIFAKLRGTPQPIAVKNALEVVGLPYKDKKLFSKYSLGMKQRKPNPWEDFAQSHKKGDKVSGQIKSITDFGVFLGLPGGIDGLVHLSDLSWNESGEEAVRKYKKGDELEAVVLAIDTERERISLGIKQMGGDPFSNFASPHDKHTLVKGTVKSVDAKGAIIDLGNDVEGYLRAAEISADRVEDATTRLAAGDEVEALSTNIDRKNRSIQLSIRAKDAAEARDALDRLNADATAASGTTNLGALLKAKLEQR